MSVRPFLIAAAAMMLLISLGDSASAQNYPWCAQYGWRDGPRNCGFVSWNQCMATVSGVGGFCERNAMYVPSGPRKSRRVRR
jgi:uncharacterized protein DUF3551